MEKVDISINKTLGKRTVSLGGGDVRSSLKGKVGGQTKMSQRTFFNDMDSIAYGVEAWMEENTGYSRRVTETTVGIARKLGVPEAETGRWAASRLISDAKKGRVIKSLLGRKQDGLLIDRTNSKGHLGWTKTGAFGEN